MLEMGAGSKCEGRLSYQVTLDLGLEEQVAHQEEGSMERSGTMRELVVVRQP